MNALVFKNIIVNLKFSAPKTATNHIRSRYRALKERKLMDDRNGTE